MHRPRDYSNPHGHRGLGLDSARHPTRGGPPQGPRSGPSMTNRRMPDYDEGMGDMVDGFDNMGMDPRKHAAPGRSQGRRGPDHLDDMDAFDEKTIDPRRASVRGEPQGRAGLGRRRMDEVNGFGEDELGPRRASVRGEPQGRASLGRGRMDDMDGFGEDELGPRRPSTGGRSYVPGGSRAGGSRAGGSHAGGSLAGGSRAGAGHSRAGGQYGARLMPDDIPHAPRDNREPRPSITSSITPLRELEVELDRVEESQRRAEKYFQTAKKSDLAFINKEIEAAVWRSTELKNEIYKIDPKSERVDNTARFFLHLPYNHDLDHGKEGAPRGHPSLASRHAGDRAHQSLASRHAGDRAHHSLASRHAGDRGHRESRLDARDHY